LLQYLLFTKDWIVDSISDTDGLQFFNVLQSGIIILLSVVAKPAEFSGHFFVCLLHKRVHLRK